MQLVVLAGGLGTRLSASLPLGLPKAMAPVAGRPFLEHVLDRALAQGVDDVVLLVGHHANALVDHFGEDYRGARVRYSHEGSPLGTGGAVRHARQLLAEEFVLLNGDTYVEVDLVALAERRDEDPLALVLTPVADASRFGAVEVDGDLAVRLAEKAEAGPALINAGVYCCRRTLLDRFPDRDASSFETDVLQPYIASRPAPYVRSGEVFFDIGVPADHVAADTYFSHRAG